MHIIHFVHLAALGRLWEDTVAHTYLVLTRVYMLALAKVQQQLDAPWHGAHA